MAFPFFTFANLIVLYRLLSTQSVRNTYSVNQKTTLCMFLEDGRIELSNNRAENSIRPFCVGRKGWLFSDTTKGAKASAVVYSLIETAKANKLNV